MQRCNSVDNAMNCWYPGPSFNIQTVFPGIPGKTIMGIPIIGIPIIVFPGIGIPVIVFPGIGIPIIIFPGIGIPIIVFPGSDYSLSRKRDPHGQDNTAMMPSYLFERNFYVGNLIFYFRMVFCVLWYVSLLTMVTLTVWSFIMDWSCGDNVV